MFAKRSNLSSWKVCVVFHSAWWWWIFLSGKNYSKGPSQWGLRSRRFGFENSPTKAGKGKVRRDVNPIYLSIAGNKIRHQNERKEMMLLCKITNLHTIKLQMSRNISSSVRENSLSIWKSGPKRDWLNQDGRREELRDFVEGAKIFADAICPSWLTLRKQHRRELIDLSFSIRFEFAQVSRHGQSLKLSMLLTLRMWCLIT